MRLRAALAPRGNLVARFAPILYGRNLPEIPGRYENARTDVPLLAYHTTAADAQGNRTIEYTTIWSNEDEGTDTAALMARWGRTTDIEWIYRVTVDAAGRRIADAYQAANHETKPFDGLHEDDHPLLETATGNNNTAAVTDRTQTTGYRFFLDTSGSLPAGRAREAVMDANPWAYQVMAKEMIREGKVEPAASPDTPQLSDQRNYLFAEVAKQTTYPAGAPPLGSWVGTALAVKLKGDDRWYPSNHAIPDASIQRDDPAATTIELPPGANQGAVSRRSRRWPSPSGSRGDYAITVTAPQPGLLPGQGLPPPPVVRPLDRQPDAHAAAPGRRALARRLSAGHPHRVMRPRRRDERVGGCRSPPECPHNREATRPVWWLSSVSSSCSACSPWRR